MRDLTINGVNLYSTYNALLLAETLSSQTPAPRTQYIEIAGRVDGDADLTNKLGYITYSDREGELQILSKGISATLESFLRSLSGKDVTFSMWTDSGYEYRGRVGQLAITRYLNSREYVLPVRCNPYRYKPLQTVTNNCACGKSFVVQSGAKPVQPTITVAKRSLITANGVSAEVSAGTWLLEDLFFIEGSNSVFIDTTYGETGDLTWSQLSGTWSQQTGTWSQLGWSSQARQTKQADNSYNATITYEWGDL